MSILLTRRTLLAAPLVALLPRMAHAQELPHPLIPYRQGGAVVLGKAIDRHDPKQSHDSDSFFSAENPKETRFTAAKVTESDRVIVTTHHRLDRLLLGSASVSASVGALSIRGEASQRKHVVFDSRTINIVWWARIEFPESLAGGITLTESGRKAFAGLDAKQVKKVFGTDVVTGITREARVAVIQSITCSSEETCRSVSARLSATYGSAKFGAEITSVVKSLDEHSRETFHYFQNGLRLADNAIDCLVEPGKQQAAGYKLTLAAIDSTSCPIMYYRRASLDTRPEFAKVKGLAEVIEGDLVLARKREEVVGWLGEAIDFHDLLVRLKASKPGGFDGGRAAAFGRQIEVVRRWLARPTLPGPKLPATTPTKADVEGALVHFKGWVFGEYVEQSQDGGAWKTTASFATVPVIELPHEDLIEKLEVIENDKFAFVIPKSRYSNFGTMSRWLDRTGNSAKSAEFIRWCGGRGNPNWHRLNQITEPVTFQDFDRQLGYYSKSAWGVGDRERYRIGHFQHFLEREAKRTLTLRVTTTKVGASHTFDIPLGNCLSAPGIRERIADFQAQHQASPKRDLFKFEEPVQGK